MDAFAPEPGVGDHFALLAPDIFNMQDERGRWVDAALVSDEYGWSLSTPSFAVRFPKVLSADAPVVYEAAGGSISVVPEGVSEVAGSVSGRSVRYQGALGSTDLLYEVTPQGYKESVILGKGASGTITWRVSTQGLSLAPGAGGEVAILAGGARTAAMPPPVATDSAAKPLTARPSYALTDLGGGTYTLSVTLPEAFLAAATYPITLDPGVSSEAPQADTYANANKPNQNYGAATSLQTGPSGSYRAFIKFPTSWQRPGRLIYSAELWVRNVSEGKDASEATATRITDGWTEGGLTWNNQPGVSTTPNPRTANAPAGGWFVFQLKNLYQRLNDGEYPDYGSASPPPTRRCSPRRRRPAPPPATPTC